MMRMRTKTTEFTAVKGSPAAKDGGENELEVRPGGMLVQKRDPDEVQNRVPPPTIRVRVKYGSVYHEIIISATATFGELKKMLTGPTGLHHEDQKLIYKDKERNSKSFLDVVGVKDKSKMVLLDDPISRERRQIEARKTAKIAKAAKSVSDIGLDVDKLAAQVSALESVISKGRKVADKMVSDLIEKFMNHLIKLDEIKVEGELNQQKKLQVEKIQRFVETLDVLKLKNTTTDKRNENENHVPKQLPTPKPRPKEPHGHTTVHGGSPSSAVAGQPQEPPRKKGVVVTTQWETFDSLPTIFPAPQTTSTSTSTTGGTIQHSFNWDLLLK